MMLKTKMQKFFFDRDRVRKAVASARRRAYERQGALVRTIARRSIRKSKKSSAPGQPPRSHSGELRNEIYFGYDRSTETVVVGPARLNIIFFDGDRQPVSGLVPEILEYGGVIQVLEVFKYQQWQRADLRSRRRNAQFQQRFRRSHIAPRPYMRPSLAKAKNMLANAWKDEFR